jgi:glycosyltransferase involved in cell wall biosynthesis
MKIKVAMIADHPGDDGKIDGGVQAVTSYLVSALTRLPDIDLYILSFRLGLKRVLVNRYATHTHYLVPYGKLGTLTFFAKDQATLNNCLADIEPDIVHSQGAGHEGILAIRCQYPAVITIHGIHVQEAAYQSGLKRRFRTRLQGWMSHHYCIRKASHTILISPYVAEFFGDSLSGRRYLIPNPVDECFFNVTRQEEPGRILFLGRLYALKGVRDLVSAVSRLVAVDNLQLVLAGSLADRKYVDDLKIQIGRLDLNVSVQFTGILPTEELLSELSRCSCLVLPSYQETAPMVIQEAMAAGVPVIASNICGIPYQMEHNETGLLFSPGNIDELTYCLKTLLASASKREEFGLAAKQRAAQEYRAAAVAQKTLDVYRHVME